VCLLDVVDMEKVRGCSGLLSGLRVRVRARSWSLVDAGGIEKRGRFCYSGMSERTIRHVRYSRVHYWHAG